MHRDEILKGRGDPGRVDSSSARRRGPTRRPFPGSSSPAPTPQGRGKPALGGGGPTASSPHPSHPAAARHRTPLPPRPGSPHARPTASDPAPPPRFLAVGPEAPSPLSPQRLRPKMAGRKSERSRGAGRDRKANVQSQNDRLLFSQPHRSEGPLPEAWTVTMEISPSLLVGAGEGLLKRRGPPLPPVDAVRVYTVLEDCVDQLTVLGHIMPVPYEERRDAFSVDGEHVNEILSSQKYLGTKFQQLMDSRAECQSKIPLELGKIAEFGRQLQETSVGLKSTNRLFSLAAKRTTLPTDHLKKVQADRQYVSDVIEHTLDELLTLGTFQTLLRAVNSERKKKIQLQDIILREEMGRKKIKALQKQINDVKKEKEFELQNRDEMIAYLKDQLQEMKAKTDMENRYVKKDADLQIAQTQKKCANADNDLQNEVERLRNHMDEEIRVHLDIENFLKHQLMIIEERLEYWMEKYEKDTEAKQQELNSVKASRTADQLALQELAKQCLVCEQVIIEDRKEKENARKKLEQDAREMRSILKLQAWWRGMMVRRFLGPYKALKKLFEEEPPPKEKGKKGKAGKPGAKKKK
uniref:dynein regulatory complex protein 9 n=1 Tax=Euleptes europaea TaxID=460621 RepID=UPI0025420844|nr:dynein regulatory complex protein 9 [Euleptes europaea]